MHNGGGVGWGEVMNGGFGLVLDGSKEVDRIAESMLCWDVYNGVARRSWSGNNNAQETIKQAMTTCDGLRVTVPNNVVDESVLKF